MGLFLRFCSWFTHLLALWVVIFGLLGYLYPPLLLWISKSGINCFFAVTMFAVGLTLKLKDFFPALKKPHIILLGNLTQFLVMPILAFTIGKLFNFPPTIFIGFILVGTVPGAMASNIISFLAKADVAYSVLMTTSATILAPILTPALTKLLAGEVVLVPFFKMCWQITWMVVLPVISGVVTRHFFTERIKTIEPVCSALAAIAITLICSYVISMNSTKFAELNILIIFGIILMNILGMIAGLFAGILYNFDRKRRRTLSFEVGMQNAGLGAVLAINNFSSMAAIPPALFASWCVISASFLARVWAKKV
jgi:BASS family bile acid:Na+ symporter